MSKVVAVVRAHRTPPQTASATREKAVAVKNLRISNCGNRSDFAAIQRTANHWKLAVSCRQRSWSVDGKWRSGFDCVMNTQTIGLILALSFFGTALCFADDPHASTSNVNESKSNVTPGTEKAKPTYISLVKFTDKGMQNARQTTQRLAAWAAKVQSMGVTIKQMYWTLGEYDQVCIFDAPDDETAASVLLAADMLGNIRTQTMRAFTAAEMDKILAKIP